MAMHQVSHKILLPPLVALVYLGINLLALQYMDERNGLVNGILSSHGNHWPMARQIIEGEELTNFRYPPGFPIYVVAVVKAAKQWGGSYFFWRLVQDCLSTAVTSVLITAFMFRLTNSAWVAWSANIFLIYNLTYSAGTASDLVMASFLPWFYGGLLLLIKGVQGENKQPAVRGFLAGILIAISGLVRPDILLLLPFITVIFSILSVCRRANLTHTTSTPAASSSLNCVLAAFLGFGLILVPWIVFASVRSGFLVVYSTNFAFSHIDGLTRFPGNPVSDTFRALMLKLGIDELLAMTIREIITIHYMLIEKYPFGWIVLWLQKVCRPWYASDSQRWDTILAIQTLLVLPAIVYGIYQWRKRRGLDLAFIVALSIITYFWLVSLAVLSINRYMPPVYPFLGMFAGFGAEIQWSRISRRWKTSGQL